MKIAFNTQSTNANRHPAMPTTYPFIVYEIEDSRQEEIESLGYLVMILDEFNTYKNSININAYNQAMATPVDVIIDTAVLDAATKGTELVRQFKRENVLMGITPQSTVDVTKKCHWMAHFLMDGSLKAAIIEIAALIGQDLSQYVPFITSERLTVYKHRVQDYLGVVRT